MLGYINKLKLVCQNFYGDRLISSKQVDYSITNSSNVRKVIEFIAKLCGIHLRRSAYNLSLSFSLKAMGAELIQDSDVFVLISIQSLSLHIVFWLQNNNRRAIPILIVLC